MAPQPPVHIPGTVLSIADLSDIAVIEQSDINAISATWQRQHQGRYETLIDASKVEPDADNR